MTWEAETAEEVVLILLNADANAFVLARIVSAQIGRTAEFVDVGRFAARTLETRLYNIHYIRLLMIQLLQLHSY